MPYLLGALAILTVLYEFWLDGVTDSLLSQNLAVRVVVALLALFPLGFCLGMFMPLGLGIVGRLADNAADYVAWAWAVNGFFSVIGSVLTTMLSMTYGFRTVQYMALGLYAIAVVAFLRLASHPEAEPAAIALDDEPFDALQTGPVLERS
jgi:predicted MFS family arabinose efflux permease